MDAEQQQRQPDQVQRGPAQAVQDRHNAGQRQADAHQVQVGDILLESDKIFIDTGGRPFIPDIPGLDRSTALTNESVMDLKVLPEHLIVLGGGYIGLEFGQMFRRFGSKVTILHKETQIVSREDPEIAAKPCLIGQPVVLGCDERNPSAALRISASARLVSEAWSSDNGTARGNLQRAIEHVGTAVAKLEGLLARMDGLELAGVSHGP